MELAGDAAVGIRLRSNRLLPGSQVGSAPEAVAAAVGVQAQDLPAARLSIRARTAGLSDAAVEAARVDQRSIVRTWAMRNTLHLLAAEDLRWLRRLLHPWLVRATARRSAQLGLDDRTYRRAMGCIQEALAGGAALSRRRLEQVLERSRVDASGQRAPYLLMRASAEGLICEGPVSGGRPTYVLVSEWLPKPPEPAWGAEDDLRRLAIRYLGAYGPAAPEDMANWSGLSLSHCRNAFRGAEAQLSEVRVNGRQLWLAAGEEGFDGIIAPPAGLRLLPAFDTLLLGYRNRELHLDPRFARRVNAGGGIVKPVLLLDGRVRGTWRLARRGGEVAVAVQPFGPLPPSARGDLEAEADAIGRFLGCEASLAVEPPAEDGEFAGS